MRSVLQVSITCVDIPEGCKALNLSVLIVDDETMLAEETAMGLELEGLTTLTASSAAEAMVLLRAHAEIGVMLTDIRMPREDGTSLARRALAERDEKTALGVIFMTGHGTDPPPPGVVACIPKPFPLGKMLDLVMRTMADIQERRAKAGA